MSPTYVDNGALESLAIYTPFTPLLSEAQSKPLDDAMVIDEPVKPVAGSSKHPNDVDVIDGELIY